VSGLWEEQRLEKNRTKILEGTCESASSLTLSVFLLSLVEAEDNH